MGVISEADITTCSTPGNGGCLAFFFFELGEDELGTGRELVDVLDLLGGREQREALDALDAHRLAEPLTRGPGRVGEEHGRGQLHSLETALGHVLEDGLDGVLRRLVALLADRGEADAGVDGRVEAGEVDGNISGISAEIDRVVLAALVCAAEVVGGLDGGGLAAEQRGEQGEQFHLRVLLLMALPSTSQGKPPGEWQPVGNISQFSTDGPNLSMLIDSSRRSTIFQRTFIPISHKECVAACFNTRAK